MKHDNPAKGELVHEIWLDPGPDGQLLPGLCFTGPMGSGFRALLGPGALKAGEIFGRSHFDAMTKYCKLLGWGAYQSEQAQDHEPYPESWAAIQRRFPDGD